MGSIRILHVVCLLSLMLRAWRADCQTSQLTCSEHLGANGLSNPQRPIKGKEPQVCVSETTCCTTQTEESLRVRAAKNLKTLLQTEYVAAKSSLLSLYDDLKDYFQDVIREGRRQSSLFLRNTQKNLTTAETNVISTFFKDLQNYVVDDKVELQDIVDTFFRSSFPLVLERMNPAGKTVSSGYKQCLKTNIDSIQPFGKRPAQLVGIFEQIFEPVQNLLSTLKFGIEVLNMAQKFNFTTGCKNVLLQMKFCSMCQGLDKVKPCLRFCIDALSNCLTSEIQLQAEWRSLLDTVFLLMESIGKSELEDFSNSIYKELWNAATYVIVQKANVMSQALDKCGIPTYIDVQASKESQNSKSVSSEPFVEVRLFAKMEEVKTQVFGLRPFFQELPQELCVVDDLGAKPTHIDNCWNGKSVGRYTGLDTKPGAFQASLEDVNYLKMLMGKIQERNHLIKKFIVDRDDEEDGESGSASGSAENNINESGCGEDDEDCGSSSGNGLNPQNGNKIPGAEDDFEFVPTTKSSNEVGENHHGGAGTSTKTARALKRGNSSSTLTGPLLQLLALSLLVSLTGK